MLQGGTRKRERSEEKKWNVCYVMNTKHYVNVQWDICVKKYNLSL